MRKYLSKIFVITLVSTFAFANDIYVEQSGDNLTLDINQDGQNNQVGNSTTDASVTGSTTSLNIDQVGDSNIIQFDVNGSTFTGTINLTGNSNDIDLTCDSGGTNSSCDNVTASITMTGSSNDVDLDIGETSDAEGSTVTITGETGSDSNTIAATVDGTSAVLTLTVDGDTNNYLIDIDGDGDINGHTLIHDHTGGTGDIDISQQGIYDNTINLTTSGDGHDIDIIQTD